MSTVKATPADFLRDVGDFVARHRAPESTVVLNTIADAIDALVADIKARHPGEELRCPQLRFLAGVDS